MARNQAIEHILQVKRRYESDLMSRANVVGVGVGFKSIGGRETDTLAVVVNVTRKAPLAELAPQDVIPPGLEDVPTDVQEVGILKAL
ncbi:MAG: hypothetical protein AB1801_23175 [Chloroflexota bacterium]